jgi:hypothetical protein
MNTFELTIQEARQLERIKRGIEMVPGVIKVERITQLGAATEAEEEIEEGDLPA